MNVTPAPSQAPSKLLFVSTICLGSFLLFLVQPMVARMALPRLGGAPSVWNSAMLVYQALLLCGYAYAHRLSREAPRRQATIHIAVLLIAALWLPLGLANFTPPIGGSPIFWVPWLLIASIGPSLTVSIISEYCLAKEAIEWIMSANIPAKGPIPTQTENIIAQSNTSIERVRLNTVLVNR